MAFKRVLVDDETWDNFQAFAEALDLPTGTVIKATLKGALKLGQVQRLSEPFLWNSKSRAHYQAPIPWEGAISRRGGPDQPKRHYKKWTLEKRGQRYAKEKREGEGWYLTHSEGLHADLFMGWRQKPSCRAAEDAIRSYERHESLNNEAS